MSKFIDSDALLSKCRSVKEDLFNVQGRSDVQGHMQRVMRDLKILEAIKESALADLRARQAEKDIDDYRRTSKEAAHKAYLLSQEPMEMIIMTGEPYDGE